MYFEFLVFIFFVWIIFQSVKFMLSTSITIQYRDALRVNQFRGNYTRFILGENQI